MPGLHWQRFVRGTGFIEVLVTLVVISVGLLGVVALQMVATRTNADSLLRSQASLVLQQFAERLRIHAALFSDQRLSVLHNLYITPEHFNFHNLSCSDDRTPYACFCESHLLAVPDCGKIACNASDLARYDAYQLSCAASALSPTSLLSLHCQDRDLTDTSACSENSTLTLFLSWKPSDVASTALARQCQPGRASERICVSSRVVL